MKMSSKWSKYRAVKKDYERFLHALDISRLAFGNASPSPPLNSEPRKRPASDAFSDDDAGQSHSLRPTVLGKGSTSDVSSSHACASGSRSSAHQTEVVQPVASLFDVVEDVQPVVPRIDDAEGRPRAPPIGSDLLGSSDSGSSSDDEAAEATELGARSSSSSSSDELSVEEAEEVSGCSPSQGVPSSSHDVPTEHLTAAEEVAVIASQHNMTHCNINDILGFCRRRGIPGLPKDARTVMLTERKAQLDISGSFVHFGLAEGIRQAIGPGCLP
ncbi:hypothetical protein MTO96_007529 [Rhipicephalus appendiculatus]